MQKLSKEMKQILVQIEAKTNIRIKQIKFTKMRQRTKIKTRAVDGKIESNASLILGNLT